MTVWFYGNALDYVNGKQSFEAQNSTSVRELIDELGGRFGEKFKEFLLGEGTCLFLVNGKGLMLTGGLDTRLQHGDQIEVLPFVVAG